MKKLIVVTALTTVMAFVLPLISKAGQIYITASTPPSIPAPPGTRLTHMSLVVTSSSAGILRSLSVRQRGTTPVGAIQRVIVTDEFGGQVGSAVVGTTPPEVVDVDIVLSPGQIRRLNVMSELQNDLTTWNGASVALDLISINASLPVVGINPSWLPFSGTRHTITASSSVGRFGAVGIDVLNSTARVGIPQQVVGSFTFTANVEPIILQGMEFDFNVSGGDPSSLQHVELYDENNNLVAGPTDSQLGWEFDSSLIYFDEVVIVLTGSHSYTVRSTIGGPFALGTITTSTKPDRWNIIRGRSSGYDLSRQDSLETSSSVNFRGPMLTISTLTNPPVRQVISGASDVEIAVFVLDTRESSEDIEIRSLPAVFIAWNGMTVAGITNCILYNGSTALTPINPPFINSTGGIVIRLNVPLLVRRGSVKMLSLHCKILATSGSFHFGIPSSCDTITAYGVESGIPADWQLQEGVGQQVIIITSGSLNISSSASSPKRIFTGTNVLLTEFICTASNEPIWMDLSPIRIPVSLQSTGTTTLLNFRDISLVTAGGFIIARTNEVSLVELSSDRKRGTFQFSPYYRFDPEVPIRVGIFGTVNDPPCQTGDQLRFEIAGFNFQNLYGEISRRYFSGSGGTTNTASVQGKSSTMVSIQAFPRDSLGMPDLVILRFNVHPDQFYHVESSTDMSHWTRITVNPEEDSEGQILLSLEIYSGGPQRFFRAVSVP